MSVMQGNSKQVEIGSYFYFGEEQLNTGFEEELTASKMTYLSTCRSAIGIILDKFALHSRRAVLPAFTCHAVVEPFTKRGFEVYPYPVNKDFTVDCEAFERCIKETDPQVVLIHDYFGFESNAKLRNSGIVEKMQNQGRIVILDKTQSMFSSYDSIEANHCVGSIRKWLGIPDGAFINETIDGLTEDFELVKSKTKAMNFKYDYIQYGIGEKEEVLPLYRKAEAILDSREIPYAMSQVSRKLLKSLNLEELKRQRIKNYEALAKWLSGSKNLCIPHPLLSAGEVPFYFPVYVPQRRKEFQTFLAQNKIYATIIWGCPEEFANKIDNIVGEIYNEILCIPCDQRYGESDMKYICEIINEFNQQF